MTGPTSPMMKDIMPNPTSTMVGKIKSNPKGPTVGEIEIGLTSLMEKKTTSTTTKSRMKEKTIRDARRGGKSATQLSASYAKYPIWRRIVQ